MKSNWTRIVGIVLAAALGLALLFYLGGLICQVHQNYVQWMSGGGMAGEMTMAPIRTGILDCWANGLTLTGLMYDLLVIVVAAGMVNSPQVQQPGPGPTQLLPQQTGHLWNRRLDG